MDTIDRPASTCMHRPWSSVSIGAGTFQLYRKGSVLSLSGIIVAFPPDYVIALEAELLATAMKRGHRTSHRAQFAADANDELPFIAVLGKKYMQRQGDLYFEEIEEHFDNWISGYDVQQRLQLIKKFMPQSAADMSCLEIGCGTGRISKAIQPLVKHLSVSDISEKLARVTGERLGVDWIAQDACHLRLADETFDLVISSECIEHTQDPLKAIIEMTRVLKDHGTLIMTSPNRLWFPILWIAEQTRLRKFQGNEHWLWPLTVERILKANGMAEIRLGGCHLFPWQVPGAQYILPLFDRFDNILFPFMINYGISGKKDLQSGKN
jgi:ubiquinone/menaquinone biosynthesis C-methylase UbiE